MHINLLSVGTKMPQWVVAGYREYTKRLPPECSMRLLEIPPGRRSKGVDPQRAVLEEGERMLKAIPANTRIIALEVDGCIWSTLELSQELSRCMLEGQDLTLLVGGADGLAAACLERASARWSISRLTFPHALMRVILAEQVYRAWSILKGHPYHRANSLESIS